MVLCFYIIALESHDEILYFCNPKNFCKEAKETVLERPYNQSAKFVGLKGEKGIIGNFS